MPLIPHCPPLSSGPPSDWIVAWAVMARMRPRSSCAETIHHRQHRDQAVIPKAMPSIEVREMDKMK